jgi:hypothetical protein
VGVILGNFSHLQGGQKGVLPGLLKAYPPISPFFKGGFKPTTYLRISSKSIANLEVDSRKLAKGKQLNPCSGE